MDVLKDYRVGVLGEIYPRTLICMCGHTQSNMRIIRGTRVVCEKCGNDNILHVEHLRRNITALDGIYEPIFKDDKSFHVRKREVFLDVDVQNNTINPRLGDVYELLYDLRTKLVKVFKNGKELSSTKDNIDKFFRGDTHPDVILSAISTENNSHLFKFAYSYLGKIENERVKKFSRALLRIFEYPSIELFASCGFRENLVYIWREPRWRDSKETQPHKILGIPKYLLKFVKDFHIVIPHDIKILLELDRVLNGNNVRIIAEILKEEADIYDMIRISSCLLELYENYGYKDVRRLVLYIAREVKLQQGITSPFEAISILFDYVRMCRDMGIKYEKYPKSLKKEHDIALMNYRIQLDQIKEKKFKEVVGEKEYQQLAFKDKTYSIIIPQTPKDLIDEGESLSHCVASYVEDVIHKRCKIVFMRRTTDINTSLVTIEVRDRNIRQVKGFGNRKPHPEEMEFVQKWADAKGLIIDLH